MIILPVELDETIVLTFFKLFAFKIVLLFKVVLLPSDPFDSAVDVLSIIQFDNDKAC
jgi:hypothetical protein